MFKQEERMHCQVLQIRDLIVDPRYWTVSIAGREIELHAKEFKLLYLLMQHPGWVFTKEQIYDQVYGEQGDVDIDNVIYCLMYGLRKKLEADPQHPQYIQTVRGVGYRFCKEER